MVLGAEIRMHIIITRQGYCGLMVLLPFGALVLILEKVSKNNNHIPTTLGALEPIECFYLLCL